MYRAVCTQIYKILFHVQSGVYTNTVVVQRHSVVMTKTDKIYKVNYYSKKKYLKNCKYINNSSSVPYQSTPPILPFPPSQFSMRAMTQIMVCQPLGEVYLRHQQQEHHLRYDADQGPRHDQYHISS